MVLPEGAEENLEKKLRSTLNPPQSEWLPDLQSTYTPQHGTSYLWDLNACKFSVSAYTLTDVVTIVTQVPNGGFTGVTETAQVDDDGILVAPEQINDILRPCSLGQTSHFLHQLLYPNTSPSKCIELYPPPLPMQHPASKSPRSSVEGKPSRAS